MTITRSDSDTDRLISHADPALLDPPAVDFDVIYSRITTQIAADAAPPIRLTKPFTRRRSTRTAVLGLVVAGTLAGGGVAAASWSSAHTRVFGAPGMTENDTSEWLDTRGDDFNAVATTLVAGLQFPPGDSAQAYLRIQWKAGGLVQADGVRMTISLDSACAWEGYWLEHSTLSDAAAVGSQAATNVAAIAKSAIIGSDPAATYRQIARDISKGDAGSVRPFWTGDCDSLPRDWAQK